MKIKTVEEYLGEGRIEFREVRRDDESFDRVSRVGVKEIEYHYSGGFSAATFVAEGSGFNRVTGWMYTPWSHRRKVRVFTGDDADARTMVVNDFGDLVDV